MASTGSSSTGSLPTAPGGSAGSSTSASPSKSNPAKKPSASSSNPVQEQARSRLEAFRSRLQQAASQVSPNDHLPSLINSGFYPTRRAASGSQSVVMPHAYVPKLTLEEGSGMIASAYACVGEPDSRAVVHSVGHTFCRLLLDPVGGQQQHALGAVEVFVRHVAALVAHDIVENHCLVCIDTAAMLLNEQNPLYMDRTNANSHRQQQQGQAIKLGSAPLPFCGYSVLLVVNYELSQRGVYAKLESLIREDARIKDFGLDRFATRTSAGEGNGLVVEDEGKRLLLPNARAFVYLLRPLVHAAKIDKDVMVILRRSVEVLMDKFAPAVAGGGETSEATSSVKPLDDERFGAQKQEDMDYLMKELAYVLQPRQMEPFSLRFWVRCLKSKQFLLKRLGMDMVISQLGAPVPPGGSPPTWPHWIRENRILEDLFGRNVKTTQPIISKSKSILLVLARHSNLTAADVDMIFENGSQLYDGERGALHLMLAELTVALGQVVSDHYASSCTILQRAAKLTEDPLRKREALSYVLKVLSQETLSMDRFGGGGSPILTSTSSSGLNSPPPFKWHKEVCSELLNLMWKIILAVDESDATAREEIIAHFASTLQRVATTTTTTTTTATTPNAAIPTSGGAKSPTTTTITPMSSSSSSTPAGPIAKYVGMCVQLIQASTKVGASSSSHLKAGVAMSILRVIVQLHPETQQPAHPQHHDVWGQQSSRYGHFGGGLSSSQSASSNPLKTRKEFVREMQQSYGILGLVVQEICEFSKQLVQASEESLLLTSASSPPPRSATPRRSVLGSAGNGIQRPTTPSGGQSSSSMQQQQLQAQQEPLVTRLEFLDFLIKSCPTTCCLDYQQVSELWASMRPSPSTTVGRLSLLSTLVHLPESISAETAREFFLKSGCSSAVVSSKSRDSNEEEEEDDSEQQGDELHQREEFKSLVRLFFRVNKEADIVHGHVQSSSAAAPTSGGNGFHVKVTHSQVEEWCKVLGGELMWRVAVLDDKIHDNVAQIAARVLLRVQRALEASSLSSKAVASKDLLETAFKVIETNPSKVCRRRAMELLHSYFSSQVDNHLVHETSVPVMVDHDQVLLYSKHDVGKVLEKRFREDAPSLGQGASSSSSSSMNHRNAALFNLYSGYVVNHDETNNEHTVLFRDGELKPYDMSMLIRLSANADVAAEKQTEKQFGMLSVFNHSVSVDPNVVIPEEMQSKLSSYRALVRPLPRSIPVGALLDFVLDELAPKTPKRLLGDVELHVGVVTRGGGLSAYASSAHHHGNWGQHHSSSSDLYGSNNHVTNPLPGKLEWVRTGAPSTRHHHHHSILHQTSQAGFYSSTSLVTHWFRVVDDFLTLETLHRAIPEMTLALAYVENGELSSSPARAKAVVASQSSSSSSSPVSELVTAKGSPFAQVLLRCLLGKKEYDEDDPELVALWRLLRRLPVLKDLSERVVSHELDWPAHLRVPLAATYALQAAMTNTSDQVAEEAWWRVFFTKDVTLTSFAGLLSSVLKLNAMKERATACNHWVVNVALPVALSALHKSLSLPHQDEGEHEAEAARESIARDLVHALLSLKQISNESGNNEGDKNESSSPVNPWELHERASQCLLLLMRASHHHHHHPPQNNDKVSRLLLSSSTNNASSNLIDVVALSESQLVRESIAMLLREDVFNDPNEELVSKADQALIKSVTRVPPRCPTCDTIFSLANERVRVATKRALSEDKAKRTASEFFSSHHDAVGDLSLGGGILLVVLVVGGASSQQRGRRERR